ncbi:GATA-domain-containing protein [Macrolepiota fuliginosa MF-IS2]|uniref:GATA-domain-containing protein n=1 Tax=Macrolepiota fuliginosa MF-IS2 TaxID=1400762 RepID=A0A9P5XQ00_9AGAR|nr:GATA-domain-containing protein [Macrolepiota fuliginosa MF-IS2]
MSGASQTNQNPTSKSSPAFEFTKRKRWADILITGLTDVIIFILSPEGKVLYCGSAVTELLGWNEADILDLHLNDFIVGEDQTMFRRAFEDSIRTDTELLSYVRLRCSQATKPSHTSANDILFEINGYPHFVMGQGPDCKCFFAMAKPYPSRNIAMLNTFLELQMENERLQQRLAALKVRANSQIAPAGQSLPNINSIDNQYSSIDDTQSEIATEHDSGLIGDNYIGDSSQPAPQNMEDPEDGSRKKKFKKTHGVEQYVCRKCGRTDSPEWRKGPDGPKTLCNACGLRWAKQMRKFDEPTEDGSPSTNQPEPSTSCPPDSNTTP